MSNVISRTVLSSTLGLTECKDGYWLYDKTRGMNLSMRAKTPQDAFVEALHYYQERLREVETNHAALRTKVIAFVGDFVEDADDIEVN